MMTLKDYIDCIVIAVGFALAIIFMSKLAEEDKVEEDDKECLCCF